MKDSSINIERLLLCNPHVAIAKTKFQLCRPYTSQRVKSHDVPSCTTLYYTLLYLCLYCTILYHVILYYNRLSLFSSFGAHLIPKLKPRDLEPGARRFLENPISLPIGSLVVPFWDYLTGFYI